MKKHIRNSIKVFRARFDLTQQDLAKRVGATRQTISSIEKGSYSPSLELAFKIADTFEVSIAEVFSYEEK